MPESKRFNDPLTVDAYEKLLLPRVFKPWGELLLDRVDPLPGQKVLDVATGPGTLARMVAERVGPDGEVQGLDLSESMLGQARAKPPVLGGAPLSYRQGSADALPYPSASFDALVCQQGLQFFPDQALALSEMRRVLRPGARIGLALWAGPKAMALTVAFLESLEAMNEPLGFSPPHLLDSGALRALLEAAAFQVVQVEEAVLYSDFDDLAQALACVHGTTAGVGFRAMDAVRRRRFEALVAEAWKPYTSPLGRLSIPARALLATARA